MIATPRAWATRATRGSHTLPPWKRPRLCGPLLLATSGTASLAGGSSTRCYSRCRFRRLVSGRTLKSLCGSAACVNGVAARCRGIFEACRRRYQCCPRSSTCYPRLLGDSLTPRSYPTMHCARSLMLGAASQKATCSAQAPPSGHFVRQRKSGDQLQLQRLAAVRQCSGTVARRGQSRRSQATDRHRAPTRSDVSLMMIRREISPLSWRLGCASLAPALFPPWLSLLEGELADWRCAVGLPAPSTRTVCALWRASVAAPQWNPPPA